jgi:hypothetical protein
MKSLELRKPSSIKIIDYNIDEALPFGKNIFYLCIKCRTIIESTPKEFCRCQCDNISIDVDSGRGGFKEPLNAIILQVD